MWTKSRPVLNRKRSRWALSSDGFESFISQPTETMIHTQVAKLLDGNYLTDSNKYHDITLWPGHVATNRLVPVLRVSTTVHSIRVRPSVQSWSEFGV